MNVTIDLNADMGESRERLDNGSDEELMRFLTSANIACGGHAGDAHTMRQTLELAHQYNVAVGAHPSYPDQENFGRLAMKMPLDQLESSVREQISALAAIAAKVGIPVTHVKPHGALYHACNADPEVAAAVGRAVRTIDPALIVVLQSGSRAQDIYRNLGLRTAQEAFADRAYESNGSLRDRRKSGSLLHEPSAAAAQAVEIAMHNSVHGEGWVRDGVNSETLCIHSDTPNAPAIAKAVREALAANGVLVRRLV